jgi:hypothetical protein
VRVFTVTHPFHPLSGQTLEILVVRTLWGADRVCYAGSDGRTPVCVEAIRGDIEVADTVHWQGVHGMIAVQSDALITGEDMRDNLMHRVMQATQYPEMTFTLDSLIDVKMKDDTLHRPGDRDEEDPRLYHPG